MSAKRLFAYDCAVFGTNLVRHIVMCVDASEAVRRLLVRYPYIRRDLSESDLLELGCGGDVVVGGFGFIDEI